MERTFSCDARAVVPTTLGFTKAIPSAGSIRTKITNPVSGKTLRTGANHGDPSEPSRKYEPPNIR